MPAKTGAQYIANLRDNPAEVWIRGERVKDVTTHPALAGGVRSVASLYDLQHRAQVRDEMVYASPSSGEPVGMSFKVPRTVDDLIERRKMMTHWAWAGCGMMARTPDFMNVSIAGWAGAAEYFGQNRPEFAANVRNYYEFIRENDVTLTHTLVNLQPRRTAGTLDDLDDQVALTVVKETDAGIVVPGQPGAGNPGTDFRRDRGLPHADTHDRARCLAAGLFIFNPLRHSRRQVHLPGELRLRALRV